MPKLLLLAPCEKVIIANDNSASLITIFEEMQIKIPAALEEKLPENASIPLKWFIFTMWLVEAKDKTKTYEQIVEVSLPGDNKSIKSDIVTFTFTKARHRSVVELLGFPVTPAGDATVKVSLREQGQENWVEHATYPLVITRP